MVGEGVVVSAVGRAVCCVTALAWHRRERGCALISFSLWKTRLSERGHVARR